VRRTDLRVMLASKRRLLGHPSWPSAVPDAPVSDASVLAPSVSGPLWKGSACRSASDTRCESGVATLGGRSCLSPISMALVSALSKASI